MSSSSIAFVYPGDLDTRTGGYRYDKRIVEELSSGTHQWDVSLVSLDGNYPFPTRAQLCAADVQFADIADNTVTVVDGLAYSVMPEVIARHAIRLNMIALIHHPLALETGLSANQAARLKTLETQALAYARHVITTSELTASSLAQYDVPDHKIHAVLPGTDKAPLAKGSTNDTMNLLSVATLTPRKGHDVLLDALKKLDDLPWHMHCVGSTERNTTHFQTLLALRKHHALENRVSFHGEISDEQLNQHYCQADAFVLASFHEGYGMVLTEAIARGLPIICSDAGAMSQTVPEGSGLLIPPGDPMALADALRRFINDAHLRAQLKNSASSARQHLRSWQTAANEFAMVLSLAQFAPQPIRTV